MQVSNSLPAASVPALSRMNPRVATAAVTVLAGHAILLTGALLMRNDVPPRPLESKTITAQLLSAPVAQPVGVQSAPTPEPPKPVPKIKPKPTPAPRPVAKPTPTPLPVSHEPSPNAITAPEPTPPAPAAPAETNAKAAPPAGAPTSRPTMEIVAPKEGAHLTCQIAKAAYPALSKRRGETGVVKVRFVVGLTGRIESAQVVQSSGFPRLDDAALDAIRSSPCQPYLQNGQPMRAAYTQPYDFTLTD
ncbi:MULTISPECIES: energy transducer TonB [Burkholderia]|uniref:Protein TonB n=1 Tax=Burkholderia mayonis TaxID=1385591 RepID=A0A1B4FK78_9BURK|nr:MULTISPECIES: energy transducer TonB [Burkholderia]AOJ04053.1 energy transducer TonB [Burkholderia mayonis]KVE45552.1 energy transducer TonB [Burkholderia sp. BDU5]KVE46072.1 energy transducer TonB [Burkholderia mayonis]